MFSILGKALGYIWSSDENEREPVPAGVQNEERGPDIAHSKREFEGTVSHIFNSHGLIDSEIYFSFDNVLGGEKPQVGDAVSVVACRENAEGGWHAERVSILENWGENKTQTDGKDSVDSPDAQEERVGYVTYCSRQTGYINNNIYYNLDDLEASDFIPQKGDWVKVTTVQNPDDGTSQVAVTMEPLRLKVAEGVITGEMGDHGYVDEEVFYMQDVLVECYTPRKWDPVQYTAVESFQGRCSWRAIKIQPSKQAPATQLKLIQGPLQKSFTEELLSDKEGIHVTKETDFGLVPKGRKQSLTVWIKNTGNQPKTFCRCHLAASSTQLQIKDVKLMKDHQLPTKANNSMDSKTTGNITLYPNMMMYVTVEITARTEGNERQLMVLTFDGFKIGRYITAVVQDSMLDTYQYNNTYVKGQRQGYRRYRQTHETQTNTWMVPGQRPNRNKRTTQFPNRLPKYEVPEDIREATLYPDTLTQDIPLLTQELSFDNYSEKFKHLLYLEEIQMDIDIREFDLSRVCLRRVGEYLGLSVPGLAEGRPSVLIGDKVMLTDPGDPQGPAYEGFVHEILRDEVLLKFNPEFQSSYSGQDYDVVFTFNRGPLRKCHKAVELAKQLGENVLFPRSLTPKPPKLSQLTKMLQSSDGFFFNKKLNSRQKSAVIRILQGQGRPLPYILFGPPGTGKTVTVVEAILQVLKKIPSSRIIACTPSNSAADLLAQRLHESGLVTKTDMVRLNALQRDGENIPECILPYCKVGDDLDLACRYRILISTCVSVGVLYSLGIKLGHFTHVFIDEAGQSTEPESMISACLISGTDGQLVLAGDPQQLGPVLMSKYSKMFGLEMSLLERLINTSLYDRNEKLFADHGCYDPYLVTKLVDNYRCHYNILSLPSRLFYHNELVEKADKGLTHTCVCWKDLPTKDVPVIFHGIRGQDMREGNSPSWFNPMEAVQVVTYLQSILNSDELNIQPCDIGIITPYRKQVEHIRLFIDRLGIGTIKVGSVEEFQGQERQVIIISTVRANEDLVGFDQRHCLGFLSNPKRFNVSITRAQALLIVIGNPYILVQDTYWRSLVEYCIEIGAYTGCDPPPTGISL